MFHVNDSSSHTETLRLYSSSRCVAAFLSVVQWADALWDVTDVNSRVTALIWALRIKLRLEGSSYLIEAIWIHQETSFGCSSVRLSVSREEEKMSFYTKVRAKTQITEWTSVWGRDPVCDSAAVISPSLSLCFSGRHEDAALYFSLHCSNCVSLRPPGLTRLHIYSKMH